MREKIYCFSGLIFFIAPGLEQVMLRSAPALLACPYFLFQMKAPLDTPACFPYMINGDTNETPGTDVK